MNVHYNTSLTVLFFQKSVGACTDHFLRGLQTDFPATIPTVFKTGDKLVSGSSLSESRATSRRTSVSEDASTCSIPLIENSTQLWEDETRCVMCGYTRDTDSGPCSALSAVQVSRCMSKLQPENSVFQNMKEEHKKDLSIEGFCYACRNLVKDSVSVLVTCFRIWF